MFDSYNNATRGMSGPVRIQEQNRTECDAARDWPRRGAAPTRVANRCGKINTSICFHRSAARR